MSKLSAKPHRIAHRTLFAAVALALVVSSGCAWRSAEPEGVAEVAACRQAANAVDRSEFETPQTVLERQADTYAACMEQHGYVLNRDLVDARVLREEQVKNADRMGGDPAFYLMALRQKLRMSPAYWQPAGR